MDARLELDERALRCPQCGRQHSPSLFDCPHCDDYDDALWFWYHRRPKRRRKNKIDDPFHIPSF